MDAPKNKSAEEKEYIKNFFKKQEKENLDKAMEIYKSIEKDLKSIKEIKDWKKDEILRKIRDYANYSVSALDFFMRSKNVD